MASSASYQNLEGMGLIILAVLGAVGLWMIIKPAVERWRSKR